MLPEAFRQEAHRYRAEGKDSRRNQGAAYRQLPAMPARCAGNPADRRWQVSNKRHALRVREAGFLAGGIAPGTVFGGSRRDTATLLYSYTALTDNFLDGTSFYIMYTVGTKL